MVVVEPVTQSGDLEGKSCAGEHAIGRPALVPLEVDQTAAGGRMGRNVPDTRHKLRNVGS